MRDDGETRPTPEALLERLEAERRDHQRTRFRIFLGASPGVGKTFTMLENAQRLRAEGEDVVVGIVETHGRAETAALLEGLEVLPRTQVMHRGRALEELDLDAALARKPKIFLLDELAHTNAPGSRHAKRWQDAMELLDAGIEVHTTLNVQHVESLNDVVAQITHVRVRETVPDAVIERASELELIDVPPEVVIERLGEGKVYVPDQAERAAQGFFKAGNLHALRELALRLTAERVDVDVQAWRRQQGIEATWPTRDRIMVCIGPSPASARLVRTARRVASALRAPWIAAYVESPGAALSDADRARLAMHLRLAESLGGEVAMLTGDAPATALLELARRRNVTRIMAGKPTHPRWRDFVYGSLLEDLVRGSGDIDVHVISGASEAALAVAEAAPTARGRVDLGAHARGLIPVVIATALGIAARELVDLADVVMLFLVAIAVTATFLGRGPSILASVLSVALLDFFFVAPYRTFAVGDLRHVLTFGVMLCAGLLIGTLTDRIRRQTAAARERERRNAALYALTRALAVARDEQAVAAAAAEQVRDLFESASVLLVRDLAASSGLSSPAVAAHELTEAERTVARWSIEHGRPAGRGTATLPGARTLAMPLLAEGVAVGVLAILPSPETRFTDPVQRHLLETVVAQIALALERAQLEGEAHEARLRAEAEEMRSSLLSSVSHDLRTPIAAILGSATSLLDGRATIPTSQQDELVVSIRDESARLGRLVSNLLDMTRVGSGDIRLKKEWVPIEEMVGSVMTRLEAGLVGRAVTIELEPDVQIEVDAVLFEQVLVNLLDNAIKHTRPGTGLEVRATTDERGATIEVADRGPGLRLGDEVRIFEKFVHAETGGGVGLGLAICRGIVSAHGGRVVASNREGGGASFRITLPVQGAPPDIPGELEHDASV